MTFLIASIYFTDLIQNILIYNWSAYLSVCR